MNNLSNANQLKNSRGLILFCLMGGMFGWLLQFVVNIHPAIVMGWMGYPSLNDMARQLTQAQSSLTLHASVRISVLFFSGLLSSGLTYFMAVAELKRNRSWKESILKSFVFMGLALVIGAGAGFLSELIYEGCAASAPSSVCRILMTGIGWGIIGIGVAFTVSLTERTRIRMLRYSIAGLCGGLIAGVLFGILSIPAVETDQFIKLIAALMLGLLIGAGVNLFNNINIKTVSRDSDCSRKI